MAPLDIRGPTKGPRLGVLSNIGAAVAPILNRDLGSDAWGTFSRSERWAWRVSVLGMWGWSHVSKLLGTDGEHVSPIWLGSL